MNKKTKPPPWKKTFWAYISVFVSIILATYLRMKIDPWVGGNYAFVTYLMATTLIAYFFDSIPSLVCGVLGLFVANYYFVPPRHFLLPVKIEHFIGLGIYLPLSLLITFFFQKMHETQQRLINSEGRMRQGEAWLRLSQQASRSASFEWNIETGDLICSHEIWGLYDIDPHSVKPTFESWLQLMHPDDQEPVRKSVLDAVQKNEEINPEWRIIDAKGQVHWLSARARPLVGTQGKTRSYIGIIVDNTERKKIEEALHEAKSVAEEASKAKSRFLSSMSHELRAPLNGIMGLTDLVLLSSLSDSQRKNLSFVKSSADHLLKVINQILDLSKVEAGYIELKPTSFDIHEMIDDLSAIYGAVLKEKPVKLGSRVDPAIPNKFVGDSMRLLQILHNLLNNAVKFTSMGNIDLIVDLVERQNTCYSLKFSVIDTGIGIADTAKEKLFVRFSQASDEINTQYGGTGLGLAITKLLVEKMGGFVGFESNQGQGSCFWFTLPLTTDE